MTTKLTRFRKGIIAAIPVIIGYIPISISFGIISYESQLSIPVAVMMSAFVFAGASQFMAVGMLFSGISIWEIIIATFFMNLRHLIMNLSLMPKLDNISTLNKSLLSLGITDETFAVAALSKDDDIRTALGMSAVIVSAFVTWVIGTFVGAFLATLIPAAISQGMSVALYAMFIALLLPALKQKIKYIVIVLAAIFLHIIFSLFISSGWSIVFSTVLASLIFPFIEPKTNARS